MWGNLVAGIGSAAQAFTNDWQASAKLKVRPLSTLSGQQQRVSDSLGSVLGESLFGQGGAFTGGQATWAYPGPRVAGTAPLQQQYFNMAQQNAAGGFNSNAPLEAMYQYGQRYANDVITPNVMENFAGLGTANSGGAMKGLARELGTYGMNLNSQIGQAGMQNRALNLQATEQGMGMLSAGGATQRGIQQEQFAGQQQAFAEQSPWNSPAMQYAFQYLPQSGQQMENMAYRDTEKVQPFRLLNKIF